MNFTASAERQIRESIRDWDLKNHVDYLWRKHFGIAFGSPEHRAASFIDQQMWYEEQKFIQEVSLKYGGTIKGTQQVPVASREINSRGMTSKDVEELERKYTGAEGTKNLEALFKKQWQEKASTEL